MKYEDENFLIYYNECDKRYIANMISIVKDKIPEILNFFKLNFEGKVIIKFYDDINKYKNNLEESFQKQAKIESIKRNKNIEPRKYQTWMIANTEDGNINMQSLDLVMTQEDYKNYTEEEFCSNACHEFTHLCQQQLNSKNPGWFWEVLATTLGNLEYQHEIMEPFTMEDLNDFDNFDGYGAAYKIGRYLFQNYDSDFILEMVKDNNKLYNTIPKVITEINKQKPIKL